VNTRQAILPCPDCDKRYWIHARLCDKGADECANENLGLAIDHEDHEGAKVIELTERTDIHTYSTEYWRWYESERELVEPPREDE